MTQPSEAKYLSELTEVPADWPLATVIDAFGELAAYGAELAREAVSRRLVELWASQPEEAEAWLQRCRERFPQALAVQATRAERLCEALLWHGAGEYGKYQCCDWRFSEAGLLQGEPEHSVAERESLANWYRGQPFVRTACRKLSEAAESTETARKRQKLEEETAQCHRLEAELQRSQEEGRELRNRLAVAEAKVRRAQTERATLKEQREELAARTAAAESAVVELQKELRQLQEEHGKCQERGQELANRSEAEAAEHATTKERLLQAEADAAERRQEVQRLQAESRGYQERCQQAEGARSAVAESKVELQLENARLQERCEQLQQQLAKAEGQIQVLREEKATYKERCRQLERGATSPRTPSIRSSLTQQGPTPSVDAASGGQEPKLTEELGYVLVDDGVASSSAWSCSSWFSVQPDCFMPDAIFKTRSGRIEHFLKGRDLQKGSQVVAGDGETLLEVALPPEICLATEVVDLQAGGAMLRVTPDHPVQVPDARGELDKILYIPAGQLKVGDSVVLDSGEAAELTGVNFQATECEVLKIVFEPDLPVAVFSAPPCIQSKGHQKKPPRRSGECRKGAGGEGVVDPTDGAVSIPDTAVGSARIEMDLC
ncbi:unnamed protein product [Symbiodinium sp. CCMP2592]|nr:unnamed protein product [Symbiodinium sp. CCMP2592]